MHPACFSVVLCSGQSNMGFSANLEFNASAEIADSVVSQRTSYLFQTCSFPSFRKGKQF